MVNTQDMRRQFLSVYLLQINDGISEVVSVYRINLALIAVGPVHHSIELKRVATGCLVKGSQYSARLNLDVKFVQTQRVEIQLSSLQAE